MQFTRQAGDRGVRAEGNSHMGTYFSTDPKLTDHKRQRNRLLSPWSRVNTDDRMFLSSWTHSRLPEVVWIYELIHHLGVRRSLNVLVTIAEAGLEAARQQPENEETFLYPYFASSWSLMTGNDVKHIVTQQLRLNSVAKEVAHALGGFHCLYPEYPLRFLATETDEGEDYKESEFISEYKGRLAQLTNRFSVAAVRLHSHIYLSEARSGRMHLPAGMALPDFDLIYSENPDTDSDDFNRSAGMVRGFVSSAFAMFTSRHPLLAAKYFWNRGLELEECALPSWSSAGD